MIKVKSVLSLRSAVESARKLKKTVAFVPTMGNLHDGHLELVRIAKSRCDYVVVSIYVNPTQFGANEDLDAYPKTPQEDARALAELEVDVLFLPDQSVIYPGGELSEQTTVFVPSIGSKYCGKDRPEHFQGVTTVVARLFNMVMPDVAVFGKKDYQQLTIIRRMVRDLAYPIQIVGVDTVRAESGLALSSRNQYLSKEELLQAPLLRQVLLNLCEKVVNAHKNGTLSVSSAKRMISAAQTTLRKGGFSPNYINICRQHDLEESAFSKQAEDLELVILSSATLGAARLLDNLEFSLSR